MYVMLLHAILIITSSFTPPSARLPLVPSRGKFTPHLVKFTPMRHLPPRGAYEVFRFSHLPPRYLWGLSKPSVGAYGPRHYNGLLSRTVKITCMHTH